MAKPEILKNIRDILDHYMRAHNMRRTQERFQILEVVYNYDDHFDVEELYNHLLRNGFMVSKATVYNTLELFLKAGLVRKHHFSPGVAHYEKSYFNKSHDHVIVTGEDGKAEKIIEFCDPRIESIKNDIARLMGIDVFDHDLYIYAKTRKK
jgi:Fur family ferric uptake transcriptional regulator